MERLIDLVADVAEGVKASPLLIEEVMYIEPLIENKEDNPKAVMQLLGLVRCSLFFSSSPSLCY
jgi:hypothetical protein